MKKHIMIAVLVSVFFVAACKKIFDSVPGQQPVNTPPTPTQVGISTGNAVTKEINSSGGSIVSYDGKLEVIVPSGAVANNTVFGIQPITDFCPGGLSSYRLSPDGMKFSNPVTLKFHYTDDDIDGSMASFLGIAYQDSNNVWQQQTSVVIDSVNKTVSVETTHFTDWSVLESLGITVTGYGKNSVPHVKINQAVEMRLTGKPEDDLPPLPLKDGTPGIPLPEFLPFQAKWYVNGILNGDSHVGEIDIAPAGDGKVVYYKAPVLIPAPSVVTISAELTDFNGTWYSFSNNNKISVNKVILFRRIKVVSDAMNFTFHMESTEDEACGAPGSFSFDQVDMNIKVVGTDVTVTQLTNQQPTIINPSVQSFNCTVTASPGPTGTYNVVSATGTVQIGSIDNLPVLDLKLVNKGASTNNCHTVCPHIDPTDGPAIINSDSTINYFAFSLNDSSIQTGGTKGKGGYWELVPK